MYSNHNYNKILKSDWLSAWSTALISALIGQFNRTVHVRPKFIRQYAPSRTRLNGFFFHCQQKKSWNFLCFDFKKSLLLKLWLIGNRNEWSPIQSFIILVIKQIWLPLCGHPILLITHYYDYRPNWTPLSPVTITNLKVLIIIIMPANECKG